MDKDWEKILKFIKENISSANFRTWFGPVGLGGLSETYLELIVPSAFIKNQLTVRYNNLINQAVENVLNRSLEIKYRIDSLKVNREQTTEDGLDFGFNPNHPTPSNNQLNPRYTLNNFVVGLTNNLAYAAAQAVVQNPGTSYNPLFIYGPSGVGKTHLMQAIGNALLQKKSHLKLNFSSSERFTVDFVDSIRTKKTTEFRNKYRSCELLLIDDIQFISGKDSTEEEFFHTFNELYSKNTQIVLTSDRPPNEMLKLESRLVSRFQGGLMVDIQLPDFDTRIAILKAKLVEKGDNLPDEILSLMAESIASNTRELEGKLSQVLTTTKLNKEVPTIESVRKLLGKPDTSTAFLADPKKVLGGITQYFNIKMGEITGPKRQKGLVLPRQIAMYILHEDCKIPMERIGQYLGGRDHTTVLHGIEKIREAVKRDREVQRLVEEVEQSLKL